MGFCASHTVFSVIDDWLSGLLFWTLPFRLPLSQWLAKAPDISALALTFAAANQQRNGVFHLAIYGIPLLFLTHAPLKRCNDCWVFLLEEIIKSIQRRVWPLKRPLTVIFIHYYLTNKRINLSLFAVVLSTELLSCRVQYPNNEELWVWDKV